MHVLHAVAPGSSWKLPAAQLVHVAWLASGLNVPGLQADGVDAPTEHDVPGGHTTHCSTLVITASDVFWCVPPGHGSGAAAPSEQ